MGTKRKMLEPFKGDAFAELREQVAALFALGQTQGHDFEGEITDNLRASRAEGVDHQMVPTARTIDSRSFVHGYTANTTREQIAEAVLAGLKQMMPGDGADLGWATTLVVKTLRRLLESGEPSGEKSFYFPLIDGLSIIRFDLKLRYEDVTVPELRQAVEKIIVVAAAKSVVDLDAFDPRRFLPIYQQALTNADIGAHKIPREMERAVFVIRQIQEFHHSHQRR
jgi:hypothetical protein